jgi:pimeloyl-ACP methyl ester carboxylesterase
MSSLFASRTVTLSNPPRELAYLDTDADHNNNSNSHVVLLLHGFLDNCHSFVPLLREVSPQRTRGHAHTRWIALDFAGHGQSSHGSRHCYAPLDAAIDVVEFLRALRIHRLSLVGHSYGGGVAVLVANALGPKVVERVVLLDALGPYAAHAHDYPRLLQEAAQFEVSGSQPHASLRHAAEYRARKNFVGTMHVDDALLLAERGTIPTPGDAAAPGSVVWNYDPLLKRSSPSRITVEQTQQCWRELRVPTLVIVAVDGLFQAMFTPVGRALTQFGVVSSLLGRLLALALWLIATLGLRHRLGAVVGKLEAASLFGARLRALRRAKHVTLHSVDVRGGGHHVHMRFGKLIAEQLRAFLPALQQPTKKA